MNRCGEVVSNELIRMIGYLALLAAASLAVWKIMGKVMG